MKFRKKTIYLNDKEIIIRQIRKQDAAKMLNYLKIIGSESDYLTFGKNEFNLTLNQEKDYIENINNTNNNLMLLAEHNNDIIATAQLQTIVNRKRISHNSELSVSVKKEYWNMKVATNMMDCLINFAKRTNEIKNIHLGVNSENIYALKLYKKFGFEKIGVRKRYFCINNKYKDMILMELYL